MNESSPNGQTVKSMMVYNMAKQCLHESLVPPGDDREVGCAISVTVLLKERCGIDIDETLSTYDLLKELITSPLFKEVSSPLPGDVAICATGTQTPASPLTHGHVGIWAIYGVLSNNSYTGLWSEFYTHESWIAHYETVGQFKTRYFRAL